MKMFHVKQCKQNKHRKERKKTMTNTNTENKTNYVAQKDNAQIRIDAIASYKALLDDFVKADNNVVKTALRRKDGEDRCIQCFIDMIHTDAKNRFEIWACTSRTKQLVFDIWVGSNVLAIKSMKQAFETVKAHISKTSYDKDSNLKEVLFSNLSSDEMKVFFTTLCKAITLTETSENKTEEKTEEKTETKTDSKTETKKTAKKTTATKTAKKTDSTKATANKTAKKTAKKDKTETA